MSTIFGGGKTSASEESLAAQQQANIATQAFIEQQAGQARADVSRLFPGAQQVMAQGAQGALDVIGQGIPEQLRAFTGGNVGAQQALQTTLPQFQAAILGQPVDFSAFQPVDLGFDTSFLQNLQAPTTQQPVGALTNISQAQPAINPVNLPQGILGNISGINPQFQRGRF